MNGRVRIGVSGWRYPPWRGVFYPRGLTQKRELAWLSRVMPTLEVNGSFYSLLHTTACARWVEETPRDFLFAVKGSRFITHMKRLRGCETALANFFAAGVLVLGQKLGPILFQLPPAFAFDEERLTEFFTALPRTLGQAAELARTKHDARVASRAFWDVPPALAKRKIRYALEVRHPSFHDPRFIALLRAHRIASCVADTAGLFPDFEDVTADFVYVRLHGDTKLYESGYTRRSLERWAARIERWAAGTQVEDARLVSSVPPAARAGRDVYVYFDNDARVRAPFDALMLRAILDGGKLPRAPAGIATAGEPARETWPAWKPATRQ